LSARFEDAQRHLQRGESDACYQLCEQILETDPQHADALHYIGILLAQRGDPTAALASLQAAVDLQPSNASWQNDLGVALTLSGRPADAAAAFAASLSLNPDPVETRAAYARALLECGCFEKALVEAERALAALPRYAFLHRTLGQIYHAIGRLDDAATAFQECVRIAPENPENLQWAAGFARDTGEESLAAQFSAQLCALLPDSAAAWGSAAGAYIRTGELDCALPALEQSFQLDPADSQRHSVLLYASLMDPARTGESLCDAHRQWQSSLPRQAPRQSFPNSRDPQRSLRLGILTGEFISASMRFFVPPFLRHHTSAIELFAYDAHPPLDPVTDIYRLLFRHWRDVSELSTADIAAVVRSDEIDILLDISGHLPHHRLSTFAVRAAPIQIAYPRYPGTTGLDAMDYRFTDAWADPVGLTEHHYTEKLLRLPSGYLVYQPPADAPPVSPLPAGRNGYVTFGFLQTPLKLNSDVLDALALILVRVPEARLLFHYAIRDFDRPGRHARLRIEQQMAARGIDPSRLSFRGPLQLRDHLSLVTEIDVALDSFPFSGQTTTCECLWMGVPVVTLAGDRFSARVSAAILYRAALDDWVAASESEYSEIAFQKTSDLSALAKLRQLLRATFRDSAVLDGEKLAREMEFEYRAIWRRWCCGVD
jgi:protein O-GlcNAc transferase